jgi:hypothetical protein
MRQKALKLIENTIYSGMKTLLLIDIPHFQQVFNILNFGSDNK